MRFLKVVFLFLMIMAAMPAMSESVRFLSSIPELPLPAGVVENYEDAAMFDAPNGRIVEVELSLQDANATNIISYYQDTLPSLGWTVITQGRFYKGNESLKITLSDSSQKNRITILLEPR